MSVERHARGVVFLVGWDGELAAGLAGGLRAEGWQVELESLDGGEAYRRIRKARPDAVVITAARPSHGAEVARSLRGTRATRELPILCVDADENARERIAQKAAAVRFVTSTELPAVLAEVTRQGVAGSKP